MFKLLTGLANEARAFLLAVGVVCWLGATLFVAVSRRSVLAAGAVFVAGAFLMWGMYNSDFLRDKAGEDVRNDLRASPPALVIEAQGR